MSEFKTNNENENLKNSDKFKTVSTSDGEKFNVEIKYLLLSKFLSTMIGDCEDDDDEDEDLPIPSVDSKHFEKIIDFMKMYHENQMAEIEKPLRSNNLKDIVGENYAEFINIEEEFLFSLIMKANYLDIQPLLNLGCAKVASMIKGKSPEEIRKIFDIQDDVNQ